MKVAVLTEKTKQLIRKVEEGNTISFFYPNEEEMIVNTCLRLVRSPKTLDNWENSGIPSRKGTLNYLINNGYIEVQDIPDFLRDMVPEKPQPDEFGEYVISEKGRTLLMTGHLLVPSQGQGVPPGYEIPHKAFRHYSLLVAYKKDRDSLDDDLVGELLEEGYLEEESDSEITYPL